MGDKSTLKKCISSVQKVLDAMPLHSVNTAEPSDASEARRSMLIMLNVFVNRSQIPPIQENIDKLLNYAEVNIQAWQGLQSEEKRNILDGTKEELQIIANSLLGEQEARMLVVSEFDPLSQKSKDRNNDQLPTDFHDNVHEKTESGIIHVPRTELNFTQTSVWQNTNTISGHQSITTTTNDPTRQNRQEDLLKPLINVQHGNQVESVPYTKGQQTNRQNQGNNKHVRAKVVKQQSQEEIIKDKEKQIQNLSSRLSKMAGDKLKQGNPNISDLSDKHRPVKLAEQFAEVYDNEWSDAFEELTKTRRLSEIEILRLLKTVLENGIEFCKSTAEMQMQAIVGFLEGVMRNPDHPRTICYNHRVQNHDQHQELFTVALSNVKEAHRLTAAASIPWLKAGFKRKLETTIVWSYLPNMAMEKYLEKCIALLWIMLSQDPPMHLEFCKTGTMRSEHFREYTKCGRKVVECAWPALFLYQGGPLMTKGVAALE